MRKKVTRRKFLETSLKVGAGMAALPAIRNLVGGSNYSFEALAGTKEIRLWA